MKRYLTSYSKNYIKVRDRKLSLETEIYTTDRELADTVQDAIKSTNYHLTNRKMVKYKLGLSTSYLLNYLNINLTGVICYQRI